MVYERRDKSPKNKQDNKDVRHVKGAPWRREAPPTAEGGGGPWVPMGPPAPGDPSQHLTAGTRMFYALDSRNTDVLCTARANQGRRKQPAGLRIFFVC